MDEPRRSARLQKQPVVKEAPKPPVETPSRSPIFTAIKNQNFDEVKRLVMEGADLNEIDRELNRDPINYALLMAAPVELIELMLNKVDKITQLPKSVDASLQLAITYYDSIPIIKLLLEKGADIKNVNYIALALYYKQYEIAKILLDHGANLKGSFGPNKSNIVQHAYSVKAPAELIFKMIDKGADINWKDEGGNTLVISILKDTRYNIDTIKKLIDKGADVNVTLPYTNRPILSDLLESYSGNKNNENKIKLLLESGADVNKIDSSKKSPLIYSIQAPTFSPEIIKLLLEKGANTNLNIEPESTSPLSSLIMRLSRDTISNKYDILEDMIKLFIQYGADINHADIYGITPLVKAIQQKCPFSIIKILVDSGANVNTIVKDKNLSPLFLLVIEHHPLDVIKYLVSKGADIQYKIPENILTVASSADYTVNEELVNYFLDLNVDVNAPTKSNFTALMYVISAKASDELIMKFIKKGADVNVRSKNGVSPLNYYIYSRKDDSNPELVETFLQKGVSIHQKIQSTPLLEFIMKNLKNEKIKQLACKYADPSNDETIEFCGDHIKIEGLAYKGFTKSDVELFNRFFDSPPDFSFCPVCLMVAFRTDGCMYMKHKCKTPYHKDLFKLYSVDGYIEWCTLCGRISNGQHHHYVNSLPTDTVKPALAKVQPSTDFRFFDKDCKASGGGGNEEKVRRIHRLLGYACQLQSEVGKITDQEARTELIEEVWTAASARNRDVPVILEKKEFGFPCVFPEDTKPEGATEQVFPDILRPADEKDLVPIRHDPPDNTCVVEMGPHEDDRPVWQFQHKQPDGSINKHEGNFICAEDLELTIRANPMDGRCFDPSCKAKIYPEEVKGIVSPEFYEIYRKNFNRENAKQTGSAREGAPLLRMIQSGDAMCALPRKKGARRTYRQKKRKSKTLKRR